MPRPYFLLLTRVFTGCTIRTNVRNGAVVKVACVWAPHLAVQVERRRDVSLGKTPLVVGGRPWDPGAVLDCCAWAEAAGVAPGMRLAQAEKLCPEAEFVAADEATYRAAHESLLVAGAVFTDLVETAALGQVYVDVGGLERRIGPDDVVARRLVLEALQASGLDVRVGVGSGKFVAEQAARAARPGSGCVVAPDETRQFLGALPTGVLPLDAEMERRLGLLGIRTLRALAELPRLAVVRQFGAEAGTWHDLARGQDGRVIQPDSPPLAFERERAFDDPVRDSGRLLAHAVRIAAELGDVLLGRGFQAEGVRLCLAGEAGEMWAAGAAVKPPSADAEKLRRLVRQLLGELAPGEPVVGLTVVVYPLRPFHLGAKQLALFAGSEAGVGETRLEQLREVLRRLRERFGETVIMIAALLGGPQPLPVQVTMDGDGRPCAVVWRDDIHDVVVIYEAWSVRQRWWSMPVERDYFRLETGAGRVWVVFLDRRAGRWMMERSSE